jgi:hypothetical protein
MVVRWRKVKSSKAVSVDVQKQRRPRTGVVVCLSPHTSCQLLAVMIIGEWPGEGQGVKHRNVGWAGTRCGLEPLWLQGVVREASGEVC